MHITTLRKVRSSIMLAVPPVLLDVLQLRPGAKVGIAIESGRLIVKPHCRPRYRLDEILSQCDARASRTKTEPAWLAGKAVGGELL